MPNQSSLPQVPKIQTPRNDFDPGRRLESTRLAPRESPASVFRDFLRHGEFRIQRCRECGNWVFYPRLTCTHCGCAEMEWLQVCGRGTVYSVSIVNRRSSDGGPYNIVLVDLEEGVRMMSRMDGITDDKVSIGMLVKARIAGDRGEPLVIFEAADERGEK